MKISEIEEARRHKWDEQNSLYWSYGMLCDPAIMSENYGADLLGVATLFGYKLELFRHANVHPDPGNRVLGCLWQLPDPTILRDLDSIEGTSYGYYRRKLLPVYMGDQKYTANVYVMTPNSREDGFDKRAGSVYLERIVSGYTNAGISVDQLAAAWNEQKRRLSDFEGNDI